MRGTSIIAWLPVLLALALSTPASAQTTIEIALKSGESAEISDLSWTVNCKTFLKGLPEVEILDGPPGVIATVTEKMVLPRLRNCAKRVPGGLLTIKAGEITEDSATTMRVRVKYNTLEGRRQSLWTFHVVLIAS
jgi:hypothetical protein